MWGTKSKKAAVLALSVALLLAGCSKDKSDTGLAGAELIADRTTTYRTEQARISDLVRSAAATAEPVYIHRSTVTTGRDKLVLESMEVKRGDFVAQGDVLAVFSGTGSLSEIKQLELELDYALKAYEDGCAAMESAIEAAGQAPSGDIYDERIKELNIEKQRAAYELYRLNTEKQLASLRERIEKAEASVGKQYVYAPFDGIVRGVESIVPGIELEPGTPLMTLSRVDSLVLYSNTAADMFMYNKQVSVSVKSGDDVRVTTGRVVSSSGLLPGYFGAFVYIKPDDPSVIGSMTEAKVSCEYVLMKDAIIVPRTGVDSDKGKSFVTILDGNTVRKRYIVAGPQLPRETVVFQGVRPGDLIITSRYTS